MRMPMAILSFDLLPFFTPATPCAAKETRGPTGGSRRLGVGISPDRETARAVNRRSKHATYNVRGDKDIDNPFVDTNSEAWCDVEECLTVARLQGDNRTDWSDCRCEVETAPVFAREATRS